MNRIILAYNEANVALAQKIDSQLSRIGIPFEHISAAQGNLADAITAAGEPVLLLVTDNLLTERACVQGLLDAIKAMPSGTAFLPVLAAGVDAEGQPVETKIDRMVNMLHYMNHWQNAWMELSSKHQAASDKERAALEPELDETRIIANQMSDLIVLLRDRNAVTLAEFEANDFALFFQKIDLNDWHGQYRRLVSQSIEDQGAAEPVHLPEAPLSSGILAPEPVEEPLQKQADAAAVEPEIESPSEYPEADPTRDAQFWIERGHVERGVELLKIAAEEYPEDARIAAAYRHAVPSSEVDTVAETPLDESQQAAVSKAPTTENDINSYELMGDVAAEKGDYLFAKYCWDRVVELNPGQPGIYRKLGLMTAEHLNDHRETAIQYLQKALKVEAKDKEVKAALKSLQQDVETAQAPLAPEAEVPAPRVDVHVESMAASPSIPANPAVSPGTVLITGATAGIGRATAEIFARNGYRLILTGRRVERLVELKKELEAAYQTELLILPFDVRDAGAVQAALNNLPDSFQEIDILVNNAGLAKGFSSIHEGSLEHWETMIDTNVKGLLYVTRCISPGMVARRRGHIINLGSSAGKEVYPKGNVYCASKFAVDALTKAIRLDLHAYNIRVSQVSPGHVEETEFAITRFDGDAERAKIYEDFKPLKSSDVAEAIFFMATRPAHVNIQDLQMFGTQQASNLVIDRSGR
jgi:NADP-dependent 3-hydroxy acid dehydrogenase YdfG